MTIQDNTPTPRKHTVDGEADHVAAAQDALTQAVSVQHMLSAGEEHSAHEDQPFDQRLKKALADNNLQAALGRFAPVWRSSRVNTFAAEEADYGPEYSFVNLR